MNYFFYLKRQLFSFALIFFMIICLALKNGRRSSFCSLPVEFVIALSVAYIFGGAYIRFLTDENHCDEHDILDEE